MAVKKIQPCISVYGLVRVVGAWFSCRAFAYSVNKPVRLSFSKRGVCCENFKR